MAGNRKSIIKNTHNFPTPTANDWKGPNFSGSGTASSNGLATKVGGKLNPRWVEWLMGWPIGWVSCEHLEMDKFLSWLRAHGVCLSNE